MDHTEAIQGKFTERYLLGELAPAQRDQFEEHYFDCAICAEDVQAGAVFVDNARALLRGSPLSEEAAIRSSAPGAFASFGIPFQAAAYLVVCLLCVVGYENVVTIPNLQAQHSAVRTPEILPAVSLIGLGSRAETDPVVAPLKKDFELELEIPGGPEFTSYTCEIRDADGGLKYTLPISPEQAKNTLKLAIPASALGRGKYEVLVLGTKTGQALQKLVQYPVALQ